MMLTRTVCYSFAFLHYVWQADAWKTPRMTRTGQVSQVAYQAHIWWQVPIRTTRVTSTRLCRRRGLTATPARRTTLSLRESSY